MSETFNDNLFSERFRIDTARLKHWDYSNIGCYFITICTRNRTNYFGRIINKKMILSGIGIIAEKYWREIPQHFCNIQLDEFAIMPNRMHGIICIKYKHNHHIVETRHASSLQQKNINPKPNISPKPKSIPTIIGSFKSTCTREINKSLHCTRYFYWQSRYYDRVIHNAIELNIIRKYIKNNPKNWKFDRNNV